MAFLKNLERFYGTGERNRAGESLEEFLKKYDPKKYDCPSNTTDIVVVRCREKLVSWEQPLEVLLVKRSNHPSIGCWATPGGFVEMREDLETGAARELEEETGVKGLPLQQLRTWGAFDRDPRWRVITTSFLALAEGDIPVKAGDDAADALWMKVSLEKEEQTAYTDRQIWKLALSNETAGISLSARVLITRRTDSLLPQEKYELLESRGIAVDHGCIITQALLYLKDRLKSTVCSSDIK
ncbi:MAG: NUDIX domain-containing protein [Enterocloster sp.]